MLNLVKYKGLDCVEFDIKVIMPTRWTPHFISMLKYMQYLGNVGSSRKVCFYADGDGDFKVDFKYDEQLEKYSSIEPSEEHDGNRLYDAS